MTLEDMDNRLDEYGSGHSFIYDQLAGEEAYAEPPMFGVIRISGKSAPRRHHHIMRPVCIGCYECRWYDKRCTKPEEKFDPAICEWLSERAREKGE